MRILLPFIAALAVLMPARASAYPAYARYVAARTCALMAQGYSHQRAVNIVVHSREFNNLFSADISRDGSAMAVMHTMSLMQRLCG